MIHKVLKFSLLACLCKLSQMSFGAAAAVEGAHTQQTVVLKSSDENRFNLSIEIACQSKVLEGFVEGIDETTNEVISVPINDKTLSLLIELLKLDVLTQDVLAQFLHDDLERAILLLKAVNYLDVPKLCDPLMWYLMSFPGITERIEDLVSRSPQCQLPQELISPLVVLNAKRYPVSKYSPMAHDYVDVMAYHLTPQQLSQAIQQDACIRLNDQLYMFTIPTTKKKLKRQGLTPKIVSSMASDEDLLRISTRCTDQLLPLRCYTGQTPVVYRGEVQYIVSPVVSPGFVSPDGFESMDEVESEEFILTPIHSYQERSLYTKAMRQKQRDAFARERQSYENELALSQSRCFIHRPSWTNGIEIPFIKIEEAFKKKEAVLIALGERHPIQDKQLDYKEYDVEITVSPDYSSEKALECFNQMSLRGMSHHNMTFMYQAESGDYVFSYHISRSKNISIVDQGDFLVPDPNREAVIFDDEEFYESPLDFYESPLEEGAVTSVASAVVENQDPMEYQVVIRLVPKK